MLILDQIVSDSRQRLEFRKKQVPLEKIKEMAFEKAGPLDLVQALRREHICIIAEVKKASPSRGLICQDFRPVEIARNYAAAGAAAISVLTEVDHFQGSLDYLSDIDLSLMLPRPPLLRKDFIYDRYQIFESRAFGADAVLLITAILEPEKLQELLELSHELQMKCLVEVHNPEEIGVAVSSGAAIIGINNRDLQTFKVDLSTTERMRPLIPPDRTVVSESGIKSRSDIERLEDLGVNAVLVGETLMTSNDIAAKMRELLCG